MKLHLWALVLFLAASGLAQAPPSSHGPLGKDEILELTRSYVPSARLAELVKQHGINFTPDDSYVNSLRAAGAEDVLLDAVRVAKPVQPVNSTVTAVTNENALKAHLDHARGFKEQKDYVQAENEYRAALGLAPERADIHFQLAYVMIEQKKYEASIPENREALRLQPELAAAHNNLGVAYLQIGDPEQAKVEYRAALSIRRNYSLAHYGLGRVLEKDGDTPGAAREYHAACELEPKNTKYRTACDRLPAGSSAGAPAAAGPPAQLTVDSVRFFPIHDDIPPVDQRQYATRFKRSSLERVAWELQFTHQKPESRINYDLQATWYDPAGNLAHRQTLHTSIAQGSAASWGAMGWGCSERPCKVWQQGSYRVEFFVAGTKIATGSFEVH